MASQPTGLKDHPLDRLVRQAGDLHGRPPRHARTVTRARFELGHHDFQKARNRSSKVSICRTSTGSARAARSTRVAAICVLFQADRDGRSPFRPSRAARSRPTRRAACSRETTSSSGPFAAAASCRHRPTTRERALDHRDGPVAGYAQRKLESLDVHRREVERLIQMGDQGAAHEQLRAMLTTAARGLLLHARLFPLARRDLPAQLDRAGYGRLAQALHRVIHATPQLDELEAGLQILDATLESLRAPLPA